MLLVSSPKKGRFVEIHEKSTFTINMTRLVKYRAYT